MIRLVTPARFKLLHGARDAAGRVVRRDGVAPFGVRKQSTEPVEKLDERTLRFTISTAAVDRDRDMIAVEGWELAAFERNPVVLWAHQADTLPIGKAVDVTKAGDRLMSAVRFLPEEGYGTASQIADTVYRMARDGWLSATSVGFRPLSWDFTEDEARGANDWWPGVDFHTQELVELSIVTVPANPEALIEPDVIVEPEPVAEIAANYAEARARRRRRALAAIMGAH